MRKMWPRVFFEPRNLWVGLPWRDADLVAREGSRWVGFEVFVCLVPMFLLRFYLLAPVKEYRK